MTFNERKLYKSLIAHAEGKSRRLKADTFQAVDPLYTVRSFHDDHFVNKYSSKYGTKKQNFLPNVNTKVSIDSHSTLSKTDRARIDQILNRSLPFYKSHAESKLKEMDARSRSKQSIMLSTLEGRTFNRTGFASMLNKSSDGQLRPDEEDQGRLSLQ